MNAVPHLAIVAVGFLIGLGVPLGLYALLTRGQRRTTREIREGAGQQGWRYRRRRWTGNPTAFQIAGHAAGGLEWITTSDPAGGYDRGWTVRFGIRFPGLAGKPDVALEPRNAGSQRAASLAIPKNFEERIADVSPVLAGEAEFYREARELRTGVPAFDAAYRLLGTPEQLLQSPITPALAQRMLAWPPEAIQPHSLLAWRDPYSFHLQARLPGPPNWSSVSHLVSVGEELAANLPAPIAVPPPHSIVDRMAARLWRST